MSGSEAKWTAREVYALGKSAGRLIAERERLEGETSRGLARWLRTGLDEDEWEKAVKTWGHGEPFLERVRRAKRKALAVDVEEIAAEVKRRIEAL